MTHTFSRKRETKPLTASRVNFKGEAFPTDIAALVSSIHSKCISCLSSITGFTIKQMFERRKSDGDIILRKDFVGRYEALVNQPKREVRGLYIFSNKRDHPFYVGISSTVKRRLRQHFFGDTHNQATLAFMMATNELRERMGKSFEGLRGAFPFHEYRPHIQAKLHASTTIRVIPIADSFELALSEIYYSCYFGCKWNSFETH
jgi:hypothetical protein